MVTEAVTALGAGDAVAGLVLAYSAVVLLCALLPFVLSFAAEAGVLVLRRGRAALPALVTVTVVAVIVASTGFLLLQLGLALGGQPVRLSDIAGRLLLVCAPLAVLALLVRLLIAGLRAKAEARRFDAALRTAAEPREPLSLLEFLR